MSKDIAKWHPQNYSPFIFCPFWSSCIIKLCETLNTNQPQGPLPLRTSKTLWNVVLGFFFNLPQQSSILTVFVLVRETQFVLLHRNRTSCDGYQIQNLQAWDQGRVDVLASPESSLKQNSLFLRGPQSTMDSNLLYSKSVDLNVNLTWKIPL